MVNLQNNNRLNQIEGMLSVNGRKSHAGVTWRDYVKCKVMKEYNRLHQLGWDAEGERKSGHVIMLCDLIM